MLADTMPFDMPFSNWVPCLWGVLLYPPHAAIAGWLSYSGLLSATKEITLALVAMTRPPLWAMSFYKMWKIAMDRALEGGAATA